MKNKIILIGGAPIIGKSFIAEKLSRELGIPWISTDIIRELMRGIVRKKDYPVLSYFTKAKAKTYLKKHTPKQIVADQNKESLEVWKGIKALIDGNYVWDSYIIEGVAILPRLIYKDFKNNKSIKPLFILDDNEKRIRRVIYKRGLWDDADKYPDNVKEIEVKWVIAFNQWLKKELAKYKFPYIEIKDRKNLVEKIKKLLN